MIPTQTLHFALRIYTEPMKRVLAVSGAIVLATSVVGTASGCADQTVCPAIGWLATLSVTAPEATATDRLELCADGECITEGDASLGFATIQREEGEAWQVAFNGPTPDELTIRILDADDDVTAEVAADPDWAVESYPHGKSCGGPVSAEISVP